MNVVRHDNERQRFNMTRIMLVPQAVNDNSSALKVLKQGLPFRRRGGYVINLIRDAASPFAKFTVSLHQTILTEWGRYFRRQLEGELWSFNRGRTQDRGLGVAVLGSRPWGRSYAGDRGLGAAPTGPLPSSGTEVLRGGFLGIGVRA